MVRRVDDVRAAIAAWGAHALEAGSFRGPTSRLLARAHATFARSRVARPLSLSRTDLVTITVGGATLGGSGRTRVALACAKELARLGADVVLVGHAYRARPRVARIVSPSDRVADVGDEALMCARELAHDARVVVGPTRQSAIDLASSLVGPRARASAIVIDGPLQLTPVRSSLAILAVDADRPWGAGDVPPAGDLRAPRAALLAHADHVVPVDATPAGIAELAASLAGKRVGLFTALGRPDRLIRALARASIALRHVVRAADHGPISERLAREIRSARVDVWLATAKCAVQLEALTLPARLAILDGSLILPSALTSALRELRVGRAGVA